MSYISLLNEGEASANSSFVGATDYLTVGRALTNYGVLTQLGDANFTGANGINTTSMISSGIVSGSQLQISGQALNSDMIAEGTTNKYYSSTQAQIDAKLAISTTDSAELDFTDTNNVITASLKNNSIDVSRIKTAQISNLNVASAIVQRDAAGSFTANAITAGSLSISSGGINIPTAQTYKINNVEYLATKTTDSLTQGTTNKYYATSLFNADLNTKTTDNLTQGTTNKYYATSLFNTDLATKTTDNLSQGTTNKYYATSLFNTDLTTKTTDNLIQGTANKYYATSLFNTDLATKTTDNLIQGTTNKYYATSLFNTDLATKTTDNLTQGTANKYYSSTQAQTDAKTAISATDSTEIDFTYTAGNITASLINNSIDVSRIKTAQISNFSLANAIVQRDASGNFTANAITAGSLSVLSGGVNIPTGEWTSDTPSLVLGQNNGINEGVIQMWSNATTSVLIEANTTGSLQLYQKVNTSITSIADISPNVAYFQTDVGLQLGKSFMINNVEYMATKTTDNLTQGTTNKYYSSALAISDAKTAISATDSTEIDFTYTSGNITATLKNSSIANTKLVNPSITIGSTPVALGSTISEINGGTIDLTTGTFTLVDMSGSTTYYAINTAGSSLLKVSNVLRIANNFIIQGGSNVYMDSIESATGYNAYSPTINIGTLIPYQKVVIGSSLTSSTVQLTSSSLSPTSIKATAQGQDIPYLNVKVARLFGAGTTAVITPNWARVQNAAGTSILEVKIYTYSASGTFKVEGQISTLYNSTNTLTNFNIASFKNSASSSTQANLTNMLNGDLFVNRNIGTVGAVFLIPFITFFSFTGATPGDYFTITAYYQSGTTFASGSTVGRTSSDISSVLIVTQI